MAMGHRQRRFRRLFIDLSQDIFPRADLSVQRLTYAKQKKYSREHYRDTNSHLQPQLLRIVRRAGLRRGTAAN